MTLPGDGPDPSNTDIDELTGPLDPDDSVFSELDDVGDGT
jgi:hypothetical protein